MPTRILKRHGGVVPTSIRHGNTLKCEKLHRQRTLQQNPQESIHALKRAKGINQSLQDRGIEIGVLNNLANAHAINGEYDSVLYCLQRAYEYSFLLRTRPGNRFPSCSTWPMRCKCCPGGKNLNIATGKLWTKPANCTTTSSATKPNTGWPWSC